MAEAGNGKQGTDWAAVIAGQAVTEKERQEEAALKKAAIARLAEDEAEAENKAGSVVIEAAPDDRPAKPVEAFAGAVQVAAADAPCRLERGVSVHGDEIRVKLHTGKTPTDKQLDSVIAAAQAKGWTTLYVYGRDGKPDLELSARINARMATCGIGGLSCCMDLTQIPGSRHEKTKLSATIKAKLPGMGG